MSGDILIAKTGGGLLLASHGKTPDVLNILQHTRQPPTPDSHPVQMSEQGPHRKPTEPPDQKFFNQTLKEL